MRIVLTGGGSGGHIFPIIAVVRKIREISPEGADLEFLFLGPDGALEKEAMEKEMILTKKISSGKLRRYFSWSYISDLFKIPAGIVQSLWQLLVFMPDVVFSKGGYASVPVVIAAWMYRIPVLVHECDIMPGLANQFAARLAKKVLISFPAAGNFFSPEKVVVTGNPIREELVMGNKQEATKIFGLREGRKTILVMGGSQGARSINEAIVRILPELVKEYEIIHLTGGSDFENAIHEAGQAGIKAGREGYYPYAFLGEELPHAFAAADLVISRAGANAVSEIAANAKPAILVPIKYSANNHQSLNAYALLEAGAAVILEQDNLSENIFLEKINEVMKSSELQFELSERIKKFHNPEAAKKIAEEIINMAK